MPDLGSELAQLHEGLRQLTTDVKSLSGTSTDKLEAEIKSTADILGGVSRITRTLCTDLTSLRGKFEERLPGGIDINTLSTDALTGKLQMLGAVPDTNQMGPISTLLSSLNDRHELLNALTQAADGDLFPSIAGHLQSTVDAIASFSEQASTQIIDSADHAVGLIGGSATHLSDLGEDPFDLLLEGLETFGEDFVEGPVGEILSELDELETVVDEVESNGVRELDAISNLLEGVGQGVEFMKTIDVT